VTGSRTPVPAPFRRGPSSPTQRGSDDDAQPDVRQLIDIIAGGTNAGMLDHTILLLRDVLKNCIRRGDSSLFAARSAEEEDMDCVVG